MKRVIAFVLLGLLIYAGGFVTFYGIREVASVKLDTPQELNDSIRVGNTVKDTIGSMTGKLGVEYYQSSFLGVKFGKEFERHFYVIPFGETPNFMLVAVTKPEDIEALDNFDPNIGFPFSGRIADMDRKQHNDLIYFLISRPKLIGTEFNPYNNEIIAANRITPYIIEVRDIDNPDYTALFAGAAMLIVGGGFTVLLIKNIVREKNSY